MLAILFSVYVNQSLLRILRLGQANHWNILVLFLRSLIFSTEEHFLLLFEWIQVSILIFRRYWFFIGFGFPLFVHLTLIYCTADSGSLVMGLALHRKISTLSLNFGIVAQWGFVEIGGISLGLQHLLWVQIYPLVILGNCIIGCSRLFMLVIFIHSVNLVEVFNSIVSVFLVGVVLESRLLVRSLSRRKLLHRWIQRAHLMSVLKIVLHQFYFIY